MTTTEFAKDDLTAIKRAFRTSKATPEEVRLLVRPWRGSGHRLWTKIVFATSFGSVWEYHHAISMAEPPAQAILFPAWWTAFLLVLGTYLTIFFILPRIGLPSFHVVVRPGAKTVVLRGFGFERELPACLCSFEPGKLGCTFKVDLALSICRTHRKWWRRVSSLGVLSSYSVRRKWWRPLSSAAVPCDALNEAFTQARLDMVEVVTSGSDPDKLVPPLQRTNWRAFLNEAFVSENEIAFLLPPPNWHYYFGWIISWGAAVVADIWDWTHLPDVEKDVEVIASHLHSFPLWLPTTLALLYAGTVDYLADPWMRRAVAIIRKGRGSIMIRVGKRIRGEFPIDASTFKTFSEQYDIHEPTVFLGINTCAWSGHQGTGFSTEDELAAALDDLRAFAGVPETPRITLDG
jgi:hypothetical protein